MFVENLKCVHIEKLQVICLVIFLRDSEIYQFHNIELRLVAIIYFIF